MNSLPLNALYAYWQIYQTNGIRSAARSLDVSHSSVLRHLRELETWLGVSLVETKTGSKVLLFTPKGKQLGETLLKMFPSLESDLQLLKEETHSNQVVISTTPSIASLWLMPKLPLLQQTYPNIEIHIRLNQKVEEFKDGGFDIAIRMGKGGWGEPNEEPIMDDWLFPVCSMKSNLINKQDLYQASLIHDAHSASSWHLWFQQYLPDILTTPVGRKQSKAGATYASSDLVIQAAIAGDGIALARKQLCKQPLEAGILVDIFPQEHIHLKDAYWLIGGKTHQQSKATRLVWAWLRDNT